MFDPEQGIAIQIGINCIAEYAYLLQPNWQHVMTEQMEPVKHVPSVLQTIEQWQFIGIDSDCASTLLMQQRCPNAVWINAFVTGNQNGMCRHLITNAYYDLLEIPIPEKIELPGFLVPQKPLDEIIADLRLTRLDLLALDIEGTEVELIQNYSWHLKPTFLTIEYHDEYVLMPKHAFENLITRQGYTKINEQPTNYSPGRGIYPTTEFQFIRNDR